MKMNVSKSNAETEALLARLREVRMSAHERLMAEAHLMRAEVIADLIARAARALKAAARAIFVRPARRALNTRFG